MKRNRAFHVAFSVLLAGMVIYFWTRSKHTVLTPTEIKQKESDSQPSPAYAAKSDGRPSPGRPILAESGIPKKNEPDKSGPAKYLSLFTTPISFYGKVVDEKGSPIDGANITFTAGNQTNPNAANPRYFDISDKDGRFSITGIQGASLYVVVSKEGYYKTPQFNGHRGSSDSFSYAGIRSNTDSSPPTYDSPAVFILRKRGKTMPLVRVSERPVSVPKNGAPVNISLQTGQAASQGDLRVECWTEDQTKDAQGHYAWHCRVSVPGGGLEKREGEFDFEAPLEGYEPEDIITPPKDKWLSHAERQYFVKTADDHYARVTVDVRTGGEHFVTIESYFNPQPGSRNLEYGSGSN